MTTANAEQRRTTALFATGSLLSEQNVNKSYAKKNGKDVLVMKGVPVFRSGTFRDSMGYQHTWEDLHMAAMKTHFDHLVGTGLFADVPVRAGHPSFIGVNPIQELIGYHQAIYTEKRTNPADGIEYMYLLADFEILDPVAAEKINSGLWRNRSAEIGFVTTNAEAEYWPCYKGVAYVDVPAVEGLNFSAYNSSNSSVMFEELPVTAPAPAAPAPAAPAAAGSPAPPAPPSAPANTPAPVVTEDAAAVAEQARLAEIGKSVEDGSYVPPVSDHSKNGRAVHEFTMGGQKTTDFAAVQSRLSELEEFSKGMAAQARTDFVRGLAASGQILQTKVESLTEYAKGLSDEHFGAWQKTYDDVPAHPVLGVHGQQVSTPTASHSQGDPVAKALSVDKEVLVRFGRMGMSKEFMEKTEQFSRVKAAEPNFSL